MGNNRSYPGNYYKFIDSLDTKHWTKLAGVEKTVRSNEESAYRIDCQESNISSKFSDGHTYVQYAIQPEAGGSSSRNPSEKRQHTVMGGMSLSTVLLAKDWLKRLDEDESCQQTLVNVLKHEDVRVEKPGSKDHKKNMGLIDHAGRQYAKITDPAGDKVGVFVDFVWLDQVGMESRGGRRREDTDKWKTMEKSVRDKRKEMQKGELLVTGSGTVVTAPPPIEVSMR